MRLFARLYFDEDVDVLVAKLVRARGFEVLTTRELGRAAAGDDEQLALAISKDSVLVTHNRSRFQALAARYLAEGRKHCGIIIAVRRRPYDVASRLLRLLNQVAAEEIENQVRYL